MRSLSFEEKNRLWGNLLESAYSSHTRLFESGELEQDEWVLKEMHPQRYAFYTLQDAIHMLVMKHDQSAELLLRQARVAAESVLTTRQFYLGNPMTVEYDPETAEALGMATCLEVVHTAIWLGEGTRQINLLKEALRWYVKFFTRRYRRMKQSPRHDVLRLAIFAEEYTFAVDWYHANEPKAMLEPPTNKRFFRSQMHAMYTLAEYARGRNEIVDLARDATEAWYRLSKDVSLNSMDLLPEDKFTWLYFWHLYFVGTADIRDILHDFRDC